MRKSNLVAIISVLFIFSIIACGGEEKGLKMTSNGERIRQSQPEPQPVKMEKTVPVAVPVADTIATQKPQPKPIPVKPDSTTILKNAAEDFTNTVSFKSDEHLIAFIGMETLKRFVLGLPYKDSDVNLYNYYAHVVHWDLTSGEKIQWEKIKRNFFDPTYSKAVYEGLKEPVISVTKQFPGFVKTKAKNVIAADLKVVQETFGFLNLSQSDSLKRNLEYFYLSAIHGNFYSGNYQTLLAKKSINWSHLYLYALLRRMQDAGASDATLKAYQEYVEDAIKTVKSL